MQIITDHLTGPRPLYRQYPGQNCPQPAFVVLDCDADEPTLTAKVQGEVENNVVPAAVYYGLARIWRLDTDLVRLSGEKICNLLEQIAPLAEQLCAGWSTRIKDGHRQGFLTPEAAEVEAKIEKLMKEAVPGSAPLCPRKGRPPLFEARKKVGLTLPPALYERLRKEAARQQRTISACITLAVQEWLEERKEK